jgi:hypothetical protein
MPMASRSDRVALATAGIGLRPQELDHLGPFLRRIEVAEVSGEQAGSADGFRLPRMENPYGHLIFSVATRAAPPCRSVRNGILWKIHRSMRDLASYSSTPFSFGTGTRKLHFRQQTSDEKVIKQVLIQRQYDLRRLRRAPELLSFVQRQQERGLRPLVVDAGANIGASAIFFAGNLPKALVIAIEPDLENFTLLCKNVEGLSVEPVHGAISSAAGHAARLFPRCIQGFLAGRVEGAVAPGSSAS